MVGAKISILKHLGHAAGVPGYDHKAPCRVDKPEGCSWCPVALCVMDGLIAKPLTRFLRILDKGLFVGADQ